MFYTLLEEEEEAVHTCTLVLGLFYLFLVNFFVSVLVFGFHESWLHCNYFIVIVVLHEKLEGTQAEEG